VDYRDDQLDLVLQALERCNAHLTAAVVSNNVMFQNKVLGHTVNGTTYCGIRARTTGKTYFHANYLPFECPFIHTYLRLGPHVLCICT
jgi:hypothetical protein